MQMMQSCQPCQKENSLPIPSKNIGFTRNIQKQDLERQQNGALVMSEKNIIRICARQGLYEFPQMNNKLYLHFKVIEKIQNLDSYVNLKALYLQNNVIKKIQNLDCLLQLQNLFLQNNMITKIENLQKNKQLKILNLSHNNIFKIEGLCQLNELQTLAITDNYIKTFDDLQHLGQCSHSLTSIDLSGNKIEANPKLLDLIPQVKVLYLFGNPLVREMPNYRRTIIGSIPNLLYLDQRTVDPQEKITAEAFVKEGQKGFKKARQQVMKHRELKRKEAKAELMVNINQHRSSKIKLFERNIAQSQAQIVKLQGYILEKGNQDMQYFYETRIGQLRQKIKQNRQFINNIENRINGVNSAKYLKRQSQIETQTSQEANKVNQTQSAELPSITYSEAYQQIPKSVFTKSEKKCPIYESGQVQAQEQQTLKNISTLQSQKDFKSPFLMPPPNTNNIRYSQISSAESQQLSSQSSGRRLSRFAIQESVSYQQTPRTFNEQEGQVIASVQIQESVTQNSENTTTNSGCTYSGSVKTYYSYDQLD